MAQSNKPGSGTALRDAVRWLSDQGDHSGKAIDAACRKFDLSPVDQEFLLSHFARQRPPAKPEPG